jgi:hypothetical protein
LIILKEHKNIHETNKKAAQTQIIIIIIITIIIIIIIITIITIIIIKVKGGTHDTLTVAVE